MFVPILLFAAGLVLLIKGGDWFVDGSTGLARRFHLPEILIGATVVSIGTTLPEVMVSSSAALQGSGSIAYGNAIGSVICNTALIAALTVAIRPGKTNPKSLRVPVIAFFVAALFYAGTVYITGRFSRVTGIILLVMFAVYMVLSVLQMKRNPEAAEEIENSENTENSEDAEKSEAVKESPLWKELLLLALGAVCIAFGARFLVDNGIIIAEAVGVPQTVIALTFVALGTSLPELITAITALIKGHSSLSLGNIIGANLFNLVLVSGMSVTLCPFSVPAEKLIGSVNASLAVDIPLMFAVMLILTVPALFTGKLRRWQGITLLSLYTAFCVFQFI